MRLFLDLETRSRADLTKVGSYLYSIDPSTRIIAFGYRTDDMPKAKVWLPELEPIPPIVAQSLKNTKCRLHHWGPFDRHVLQAQIPGLPNSRFVCESARARLHGLPGGLDLCAKVLRLPGKNKSGTRLINQFSKPTKK